jgi:hypothetical protein
MGSKCGADEATKHRQTGAVPEFQFQKNLHIVTLLSQLQAGPNIRKSPSVWHGLACLVRLVRLAAKPARNSYPPIFSQNFYITTIISEFLFFHNQFINSFSPEYLHESSNFVPSSFKL